MPYGHDADASLGEIARRLDEVFTRYEQLANEMPRTFISREVFDASRELATSQREGLRTIIDAQEKRIQQLEEDKTWLYRLVISAVILAVMGMVITATYISQHHVSTKSGLAPRMVVSVSERQ